MIHKEKKMLRITSFWVSIIIGFLAVLSPWGSLQAAIPTEERAALIALYNATDGDNWLGNEGWKTPPLHTDGFALPGTEGHWRGIEVSGNHVITIFTTYNNVNGSLPPELGNLSHLEDLMLFGNPLRGSIPAELGKLSNLRNLELFRARLSGSIPPELGNLYNLKYLELDENQLSGSIPPELGKLSILIGLELNSNQLSGSIPPELGNLTNLKTLCLAKNKLSGSIPLELGNLVQLSILFLNNNKLNGEIPSSLTNLTQIILFDIRYNCLSATDTALRTWLNSYDPGWELHQDRCIPPKMHLNRTQLYFSVNTAGLGTTVQKVRIDNIGGDTLTWAANVDASWLKVTPTSGSGPGIATVSINAAALDPGDYTGTITVSDPNATNSPQAVSVFLKVYQDGETQNPFGEFSTPLDGTTVSSSIPVTGWALDDIEVIKVEIFSGETYVGDAVFVEGARPDVELVYPGYPKNYRAGWGYMMLTNFLPGGGNGTYTLEARAIDAEGHQVILGTKTIIVDNVHVVKPFGAIDIPGQGGTAEGRYFVNRGWVLTPQPNTIPETGETIDVYVDGVNLGHPVYNLIRTDVASLLPGYANSSRAGGFFIIDTTAYENGIHSISWVATDDAGNRDGIGSRYFFIENLGSSNTLAASYIDSHKQYTPQELEFIPVKDMEPVQIARGIEKDGEAQEVFPGNTGNGRAVGINLKELEPVEIHLGENIADMQGYMVVDGQRRDLPIGSTLDRKTGKFYWIPGPGYIGTYELEFVIEETSGQCYRRKIEITIEPKFPGHPSQTP
jgi:Leucine-rich repeat (LRR) protein